MPKFHVIVAETRQIYYAADIEAATKIEARNKAKQLARNQQLDGGKSHSVYRIIVGEPE